MKITITGLCGVGKSVVGKNLATELGYKHKSAGDYFRDIATTRGISLMELERLAENDPKIDFEVDRRTTIFGKENDNFVFDGRLAGECIKDALKVLLICFSDDQVRFRRIAERQQISVEEAMRETLAREYIYRQRFLRHYGINHFDDPKNFDLTIDTSRLPVPAVVNMIMHKVQFASFVGPSGVVAHF